MRNLNSQHQIMKAAFHIIAIVFCLLFSLPAEAQYGYNPYGYGRRSTVPNTPTPQKKQDPPTADEIVDLQMERLTEDLGLDVFEQAVVRTLMVKYVKKRLELQILQLDQRDTREALDQIQIEQDAEFKASLAPEKFEKYMELREQNGKKEKKEKEEKEEKG